MHAPFYTLQEIKRARNGRSALLLLKSYQESESSFSIHSETGVTV